MYEIMETVTTVAFIIAATIALVGALRKRKAMKDEEENK